jgi:PHD/YefM family antitoxin component YafN of YafNO toxin-antitoxin module
MQSITSMEARSRIYQLLNDVSVSHEPIQIAGKRSNAVLIAEDDWRGIQETLHLFSIPGMRDSIREGLATSVENCDKELVW